MLVRKCSVHPSAYVQGDVSVHLRIKDGKEETVTNAVIIFNISEQKSAN
jgi:hypothetical protein